MNRQKSVWVGLLTPGPDHPHRVEPYEVHVFRSEDKARDWAREKNMVRSGDSGPWARLYESFPK